MGTSPHALVKILKDHQLLEFLKKAIMNRPNSEWGMYGFGERARGDVPYKYGMRPYPNTPGEDRYITCLMLNKNIPLTSGESA
jgi:hypothetical protein